MATRELGDLKKVQAVMLLREMPRNIRLMLLAACALTALSLIGLAIDAGTVRSSSPPRPRSCGAGWLGVGADLLRHENRSSTRLTGTLRFRNYDEPDAGTIALAIRSIA